MFKPIDSALAPPVIAPALPYYGTSELMRLPSFFIIKSSTFSAIFNATMTTQIAFQLPVRILSVIMASQQPFNILLRNLHYWSFFIGKNSKKNLKFWMPDLHDILYKNSFGVVLPFSDM